MRSIRSVLLVGALLSLAVPAAAQSKAAPEGPWMIRIRALSLTPADKSDPIPSLSVAADKITVSPKVFPDVDISYFFAKNYAVELVLTYPQQHDVKLNGTKIGTFSHLPPTLLAQYHFHPDADLRPYVGAGVNYTLIMDTKIAVTGVGALGLNSSSFGFAAQAGADYKIGDNRFLNFDIKKVQIGSDVKLGATKVSAVKIDPWLISIGYGFHF